MNIKLSIKFHQCYVGTLHDPVQTHAIYNVADHLLDDLKSELRSKYSATRFRIVKNTMIKGTSILCFKIKEKK